MTDSVREFQHMVCSVEFASAITSEAVNRSVDCLIPAGSPLHRSIASTLVDASQPLACIFVFAVFWLAIKIRSSKSWTYLLRKCVLSALVVFYISYISITKTLVSVLNCVEVHDSMTVGVDETTDYWAVDTGVECYKGSHATLAYLLAWPFLVVFSVGFPSSIAFLVVKKVTEDYKDGWIYEVSGFMYRSFSKRYIFWESVIMSRKAVLAAVVVFSYELEFSIQAVLASFVLIMALYFQTTCRPYREEFDSLNDVESLSILISSLTFVCSIFFGVDHVSDEVRVLISALLCTANVLFFLYLLTLFAIFAAEYLKAVLVSEGIRISPLDDTFRILTTYLIDYLLMKLKSVARRWRQPAKSHRHRHSGI